MYQRLLFTFAIAISLTGVYILYSVAIQTIVVIPVRPEQPADEETYGKAEHPAENVRVAETHIPHRKWAATSSYMLRAEQAFIYTRHWEPVAENKKRIRFEKFAMAWVTTDKQGQEQAVSIVSDHALLEFAFAFDEKAPNPGRVVRAVLEGEVEIAGPDGLSVIGKNFIFDEPELKLYTHSPVNFRFQSHLGSASRMTMKLIPAEGMPGKDRPHVYGVESIHLIANPGLPKNRFVQLEVQMPQGDEIKPIKVKCNGDLVYTLSTNTAVLTTDVLVWTGPPKKDDRLECHKLTLQFVPKAPSLDETADESTPKSDEEKRRESEYQQVDRDLEFSWLLAESQFEAEGKHGPRVRIFSTSQNTRAYMGRLAYSAQTRILRMSSKEREPGSDKKTPFVRVTQNGSELEVPIIEATLGESSPGKVSLATLLCQGAGTLRYVDEKSGKLAFAATWQKQLSKTTDPETQLDLIELEENVTFRHPEQGGLIAELIKIWLVPFDISSTTNGNERSKEAPQPEPKRLLAQHGVALRSPMLRVTRTNELDILFEDAAEKLPDTVNRQLRSRLQPVSLTAPRPVGFASIPARADGSLGPPVDIPNNSSAVSQTKKSAKEIAKPVDVSADRIQVRLRQIPGQQQPEVLFVHTEGKVNISLERVPGRKPTVLEGDRVDIENHGLNREVVDVFGSPAIIGDQDFKIDGTEIHLDRGANQAEVSGSGSLRLPIPEQAKIPGLEGAASRYLSVRWDESMNFDGLKAEFVGRVLAKLGLASMECEKMTLEFMERLPFQNVNAEMQPDILKLHCVQNVKFKNATRSGTILIDNYRGQVGEFVWNHSTGEVEAQGPGWVQVWRRQKTSGSSFANRDTIQANRPISVEIAEWDYTRVQFEGKLKGNMDVELKGAFDPTIEDRVKVTHGPVRSPNDVVDPDELPSKAGTIHCDRLQFVNHPVSEKNPVEYLELIILGNAEVEGRVDARRFTASADEINFDGSKGLFVLRGHGKQNARLTEIGSGSLPGQTILFNPVTKFLKVDRATGGQWSQSK